MVLFETAGMTAGFILLAAVIILLAAAPLYIAVELLGGDPSILEVLGAHLLAGVLTALVSAVFLPLGGLAGIVVPIIVYKYMFDLSWIKTFIAYILQGIVATVMMIVIIGIGVVLLGLTLPV